MIEPDRGEKIRMRARLLIAATLLVAGCSQSDQDGYNGPTQATGVSEERALPGINADVASGPGIGVTAAPGVAFNYGYAFRLPAPSIAAVQERHAQACEELGVNRCRITGMRYRLVNGKDIEAMLAFKLDPAIAREFGKQGIATVFDAEGMLVESEISGVDAGASIAAADRNEAQLKDEIADAERRLAQPGLSNSERQSLTARLAQLRDSIRGTQQARDADERSLAKTPMVFNYGSGRLVPGFDSGPSLSDAFDQSIDNLRGGLIFMLIAAITLLPWLLLAGGIIWLFRRYRHRLPRIDPRDSNPD